MAGRERLPFVEIQGIQGLYTKSTQEVLEPSQLRIAQNVDFFDEYGAVAKIRGSSRILNNTYKESGIAKKITWIDFYKAPDLDGTILRHTLVAAGTIIGRVENGGITPLLTNRTADLYHMADRLDRFMFITNQNPDRVGEGDDLVKYDGAVFTNWGVEAPGGHSTVIDEFNDKTSWTATGCVTANQTNATIGHVTWDGSAVRIDHEFYTLNTFSIEKANSQFYVQGDLRQNEHSIPNRVNVYAYLPRGTLTGSLTSPTNTGFSTKGPVISVYVSPDLATIENNNWQFDFTAGSLFEGWNRLNLNFAAGAPGGGQTGSPVGQQHGFFYPEDMVVKRTRFEFYVATRQTTINGVRMDRYEKFDEGAPVPIASGSGDLTGVYSYKVVYVSKYGALSNAGPKSVDVTAASNAQINLTRIPVSPDLQVVARRLYRVVGNGSVWLFLDEILDNTSTTYTDTTADGSLGNETAPQAGDFSDDNSLPPLAGIVKVWKKTVFMAGDPQNPYTLYYSEDNDPESFPLINAFELDAKITAIYESYSGLVVETETGKWQVIGDNPDFSLDKIIEGMGCVGRRAAGTARLIGYAVDRDGMRLFDLSETKKVSEAIRDKYDALDKTNIEFIHTVHSRAKNLILQFNPDSAGEYTSIFAFQYPMDDVTTGYWSEIVTPVAADLNFLDSCEIEDANGDFQLLASAADGMIYELFDNDSKNWVDAAGVEYPIVTKIQTPYFRGGVLGAEIEQATGRVTPHSVELRIGSDDACVWTATVDTAAGATQTLALSSSTLSMQFGANNSLIRQRVPSSGSTPAEFVRLTFQNAEADVYTKIVAARLFFHVQPALFDVLTVDDVVS
jgi:hypothetical protein